MDNFFSQLLNIKEIIDEKPLISIDHSLIEKDKIFNNSYSKYYINGLLKDIPQDGFINIKPDFKHNGNTLIEMYNNNYQKNNSYEYENFYPDSNISKIPIAPPLLTGGFDKNYSDLPIIKFNKDDPLNFEHPIFNGGNPNKLPLPTPLSIPKNSNLYFIKTIFEENNNDYNTFIEKLKEIYKYYNKFLLNELKGVGAKFNINNDEYNLIKDYYEYLYVNKKDFHQKIEIKTIIEKFLINPAKRELRRDNNENLLNIRKNPSIIDVNTIRFDQSDIDNIEDSTEKYLDKIQQIKIDVELIDESKKSTPSNHNKHIEKYKELKLEVLKYSLSIKDIIGKILKNKLINYILKKNKETISQRMIESIRNIDNILNKNNDLKIMVDNYINNKLINKIDIVKQIKMYNHYLRPVENKNIENIMENFGDYIDLSYSNYFQNNINKSQSNNFGIWMIVKASTFDTKYVFQKLVKSNNYENKEGIMSKTIRKVTQKMTSATYQGKGTQNCYSLFNILNGQLIYCIGNINRDKFYNKIYKDKGTMFKIPGICNPNEINGPIIGVNKKGRR